MRLSLNWLCDLVDLKGLSPQEIGDKITMHTAEVEEIIPVGADIEGIVFGKVLKVEAHPNADKLSICQVDDGTDNKKSVICGAPNVKEGGIYPFAPIGAKLPGLNIKKTKIRGIESDGMLCSKRELGVGDDHDGIWELNQDLSLGSCAVLGLNLKDWVFVIDNKSLTHRPDLWGHYGIARELAAVLKRPLKPFLTGKLGKNDGYGNDKRRDNDDISGNNDIDYDGVDNVDKGPDNSSKFSVFVEDNKATLRYSCGIIDGIKILPSPAWLSMRLLSAGQRPINNVVDATNFVMLELGQPLHAFDRLFLENNTIRVRMAKAHEKIITLDGTERKLTENMLVIADDEKPVAIAGIMGGEGSEVHNSTQQLILESACFDPTIIRKAANYLGLRTEAANRYEKFQDPENTIPAIFRFLELIRETCPNARLSYEIIDEYPGSIPEKNITITGDFIRKRLGLSVDDERIVQILESLGFILKKDGENMILSVPSWRRTKDISIAEDIVEEIGRIVGYDNIPIEAPRIFAEMIVVSKKRDFAEKLKDYAISAGLTEIYLYSLTSENLMKKAGFDPDKTLLLEKPLSSDADRLRISPIPQLLEAMARNLKYRKEVAIFEMGRVYFLNQDNKVEEKETFCAMIAGNKGGGGDLFKAREMAKSIFSGLGKEELLIRRPENPPYYANALRFGAFHHNQSTIAEFGEINPRVLKAFEIVSPVGFIFAFVDDLFSAPTKLEKFPGISKFPSVDFDVAVIVPESTMVQEIVQIIKNIGPPVTSVEGFDLYRGKGIEEGKKSVAIRTVFSSMDKTLTGKDISKLQNKIIDSLEGAEYQIRKG